MMYDIIIIGGGPAGATFAKLINKKYKILLINANDILEKPCGGLLSPDAQESLAKLNITMPLNILVDPQIFSVNVIDEDNKINKHYKRNYINFNRKKFDNWLLNMVKNKVDIENGIVTKITKTGSNYEITIKTKNKIKTYTCKYLIGADGAGSITRKFLYKKDKIERLISIQEWYKEENLTPTYCCIFNKKISPTYCWTISKDNYLIYGGAYKNRKSFETGSSLITKATKIKREACLITNTKRLKDIKTGKDNIFLLGEAAGFISPSSYEGISYAFESAIILSEIFNKNENNFNKKYNKQTISLKIKILTKIIKAKILQNKILRKIIMKSNIQTIKVIKNEKVTKNN